MPCRSEEYTDFDARKFRNERDKLQIENDALTRHLCHAMRRLKAAAINLGQQELDKPLMDWWERHQQEDAEAERRKYVQQVKKKLSPQEWNALKEHLTQPPDHVDCL